ncbi:hypothetical protein [Streptomyces sp. NPDC002845]
MNTHVRSAMSRVWAGIDSGKGHHHALAPDTDGKTLLSRRVATPKKYYVQYRYGHD